VWIISIIALIVLIVLIILLTQKGIAKVAVKYSCILDSDCTSQCERGCVNSTWGNLNPDTSECFRAWACSCVNSQCYTDGKPRS
jgi:hypothetical protein